MRWCYKRCTRIYIKARWQTSKHCFKSENHLKKIITLWTIAFKGLTTIYLSTIYFKLVMFPDITHIKVNNGRMLAILNLIKLAILIELNY